MTNTLDSILSRDGSTTPAVEGQTEQTQETTQTGTEGQQPEVTEGDEAGKPDGGQKTVPLAALHAEKQKAKRYTEQVASFETTVSELKNQNIGLSRQVSELVTALQRQQPQEQKPDFFADPDAAIGQALQPVMRHIGAMSESVSRRFAVAEHGKETVGEAYSNLAQRMQVDPSAGAEYQRIMRSDDPWGSLVAWHKRETFLAEAGTDPEAYKAKLKEELLAELQQANGNGAAPPNSGKPPPVMPTNLTTARNVGNRSGPTWGGPKALNDIFKR